KLEADKIGTQGEKIGIEEGIKSTSKKKGEKQAEKKRLENQKASLEQMRDDAKLQSITEIENLIDSICGAGIGSKLYTIYEIQRMKFNIANLKKKCAEQSQDVKSKYITMESDIKTEIEDKLAGPVIKIKEFEDLGKDMDERIARAAELEKLITYKEAFEETAKIRQLDEQEKLELQAIKDKIAGKYIPKKDDKSSNITLSEFQSMPVFANADQSLLDKWMNLDKANGKYKKKAAIEELVNRVIGDTTKKGKFVEHIKNDSNATGANFISF
ncbi:354_t:CDS:1, partial [Ambispora gerdemannii]